MNEKVLNSEIVKTLKWFGAWAYKIPDMPSSLMVGGRFNPDKPCDVVASVQGRFVGIEGKMIKEWQGFGSRFLRANQIEALTDQVRSKGQAFVFLNVRIGKPRTNRLIIFNWELWKDVFETHMIPKKLTPDLPFVEAKKGMFNLTQFCEEIKLGSRYGFGPKEYIGRMSERRTRKST